MKSLDLAIDLLKSCYQLPVDLVKLLASARRKSERLEENVLALSEQLGAIRYCMWPTSGLGIGLKAEVLDELLIEADKALEACKRR